MSNDDSQELIQQQLNAAVTLLKQGQEEAARGILENIVETDPEQSMAWMWLAVVTPEREKRLEYLERTLALDPSNERAQTAYDKLMSQPDEDEEPAPEEEPAGGLPPEAAQAESLKRPRRSPVLSIAIVLVTALILAAGAFYFARTLTGENEEPLPLPTIGPGGGQLVPDAGRPRSTVSAEPGVVPAQPTRTPFPTATEGPSPTPVWDNAPATWTPAPTNTAAPTRTTLPSLTPRARATDTPVIETAVPRATKTQTPTEAGPPTSTPLFSPTPTGPTETPISGLPGFKPSATPVATTTDSNAG